MRNIETLTTKTGPDDAGLNLFTDRGSSGRTPGKG